MRFSNEKHQENRYPPLFLALIATITISACSSGTNHNTENTPAGENTNVTVTDTANSNTVARKNTDTENSNPIVGENTNTNTTDTTKPNTIVGQNTNTNTTNPAKPNLNIYKDFIIHNTLEPQNNKQMFLRYLNCKGCYKNVSSPSREIFDDAKLSSDAKSIIIKGKKVSLINTKKSTSEDEFGMEYPPRREKYVIFGDIANYKEVENMDSNEPNWAEFIIGTATPLANIPTSAKFRYNTEYNTGKFNVDFSNKLITGTYDDFPVKAKIYGNTFRDDGKFTYVLKSRKNEKEHGGTYTTKMTGGFFGNNAEAMAGFIDIDGIQKSGVPFYYPIEFEALRSSKIK